MRLPNNEPYAASEQPMHAASTLRAVPFDDRRWSWDSARPRPARHLGRECVGLESSFGLLAGVEFTDGLVEVDLAVGPERGFHGVVWRALNAENFESFFVRPHQAGNPDAVQYTPVFNGISSWQLYHGPGFWAPVAFPLGEWFRIRVVFAGERAEVFVGDLGEPSLSVGELKRPIGPGRIGVFAGGPEIHLAAFAYGPAGGELSGPAPPGPAALDGIVPAWWVSDAFAEEAVADVPPVGGRTWTRLAAEPTGLADLSRVNGIRDGRNTVLARATIRAEQAGTKRLDFGFSDRAVVYLNGRARYRGDDTYRSRDYRFLGSIGWYDAVYLPLERGENELVVAVSEDFGGWGVQARLADPAGLAFP